MTSETTLKVTVLPYVEPDPEIEIIGDDTFLQGEYLKSKNMSADLGARIKKVTQTGFLII